MSSPFQKLAETMFLESTKGITEKKLKFLLFAAQQVFGVQEVAMTFDATKKVPNIVLTPEKDGKKFSKEEWSECDAKWDFSGLSKKLYKFLGITADVKIVFRRTIPKAKK